MSHAFLHSGFRFAVLDPAIPFPQPVRVVEVAVAELVVVPDAVAVSCQAIDATAIDGAQTECGCPQTVEGDPKVTPFAHQDQVFAGIEGSNSVLTVRHVNRLAIDQQATSTDQLEGFAVEFDSQRSQARQLVMLVPLVVVLRAAKGGEQLEVAQLQLRTSQQELASSRVSANAAAVELVDVTVCTSDAAVAGAIRIRILIMSSQDGC